MVYTNNYIQGVMTMLWLTYPDPGFGSTNLPAGCVYDWDRNTYNLSWPGPFQFSTNRYYGHNLTEWKNMSGFDLNSTFSTTMPVTPEVYVRKNAYDSSRANIVIINWPTNDNVTVDLSTVFTSGTPFTLYNGQDPLGPAIMSGIYTNAISVPMTNIPVAAPLGCPTPAALTPFWGVFLAQGGQIVTAPPQRLFRWLPATP
jgi:hypothetical protein